MKISRTWLQNFFSAPIPDAQAIADALTFHAFEIESVVDDILDVKVTANRGHDCLSHRGIAKELSAILNVPLNAEKDPFAHTPDISHKTDAVTVSLDSGLCKRYIAGYVTGVKVGPSPDWLKNSLESIGQRSINNVVDATNLVMFNTGQPLHAFDAGQLQEKNGYAIEVRAAHQGEKMLALDDKEYVLTEHMLVIGDKHSGAAIGIAGVKGGKPAGINESTTDIIIESANFDGVSVRKTAAALKLRTDASSRFEQVISSELAAYGMQQVIDIIKAVAAGEVQGFVDVYPDKQEQRSVSVSLAKINAILGTTLSAADVVDVFKRLSFMHTQEGEVFNVTPSFERLDLTPPAGGPEDVIEEVGRIIGYDKVPATELPTITTKPEVNAGFYAAEKKREELVSQGYSEVFTSVFADTGERIVANKVDGVRPYLRSTLVDSLKDALEKNTRNKDLLGLKEVKLFEIGTVWDTRGEKLMLGIADASGVRESVIKPETAEQYDQFPVSETERYQTFSKYPFIIRDIAMWVPADTKSEDALVVIRKAAGELLVRSEKFDEFKKADKLSLAFRLVFQSFDRTLVDEDANERMDSVYTAVKERGWEVR